MGNDLKHKNRKISIKWSIFGYLLVFTFILLIILWVMQTVYLQEFYKGIKERELKRAVSDIDEIINENDYKDGMDEIAGNYDIRIIIADDNGERIYSTGSGTTEYISKLDSGQMIRLYELAVENGGEVQISSKDGLLDSDRQGKMESIEGETKELPPDWEKRENVRQMFDIPEDSRTETMMIAKLMTVNGGQEYLIIADSMITPVTATVYAIRVQLVYISFIMIALSLIMAVVISVHISKPIIKISNTAKKISQGNLQIEFEEEGYREIAEMSETLNYTVEELTKSERLQRELIANVSHDLRTPLTMITAYSEVMRDLPGENTPENVQVVIDEAKRLTNLVNDLLDISKLQAGVSSVEMKAYNLTQGIKKVMERYAKLVEQDGYQIEFQYDEEQVIVEADEFKIYQVIYNLVNNAINYTGSDKKVIVRQLVNGGIVRIEVIDTGEGIAEDELSNVWDRYYKVDKTHKRAVMGTGLGLSIVKNILELHQAKYGVNSIPGEGSTFWFELKTDDLQKKNR
ncbi:MAG: HAMP domain-containing sensor histidine kinase [Lachnospiraceae bacterium]|nr:HAMP domain-containing sensor histidine kinase [Lachnospiraceae bacterium]